MEVGIVCSAGDYLLDFSMCNSDEGRGSWCADSI